MNYLSKYEVPDLGFYSIGIDPSSKPPKFLVLVDGEPEPFRSVDSELEAMAILGEVIKADLDEKVEAGAGTHFLRCLRKEMKDPLWVRMYEQKVH
ncbi:Uncharacterised protein [uncultured archaeon]|nr:Uncharacterised protein [uncultured archaeon]